MPAIGITAINVLTFMAIAQPALTADKVWDREYAYSYGDAVTALTGDAFVICSDCGADRLSRVPAQHVAIKYNPPTDASASPTFSPIRVHQSEEVESVSGKAASAKEGGLGCILGTVLFKFDSASITGKEQAKLDEIAAKLPAGSSLSITGHTCTIGPKDHNRNLSEQRARNVAEYLKGKGVAVRDAAGKGECCQASSIKRLNRRVEIEDVGRNH